MMPHPSRRAALQAVLAAGIGGLALAGCSRRDAAPDFSFTLLDGSRAHTGTLRGKVVLLNFWATSCATCVNEMPLVVATHRKFSARGFETLAVAMRWDAPAFVSDFAEQHRLPFGVVIDNTGTIAEAYGDVQLTPTTFLIDRRGGIARRWVGEPDFAVLHALVEELLAEA